MKREKKALKNYAVPNPIHENEHITIYHRGINVS